MSELVDPTHTSTGLDNRKLGMWIFLATEVMLFSALIAAFLQMKARSPADANQILNIPLTAVNTFILIISSTTVVLGLAAIQDGEKKKLLRYLVFTLLLGATFLSIQVYEYTHLLKEGLTPVRQPVRRRVLHADRLPRAPRVHRPDLVRLADPDGAQGRLLAPELCPGRDLRPLLAFC